MLAFTLVTSAMSQTNVPNRSIKESTKIKNLQKGDKILVTENLRVNSTSSFDNILSRETLTGFGRWCYLGTESENQNLNDIDAGTILTIKDVRTKNVDTRGFFKSKWIILSTNEKITMICLGQVKNLKVRRLEKIFKGNIKFID